MDGFKESEVHKDVEDANGAIAFRGTIYYQTASKDWAALNGLAVIYEWDVDAEGNASFQGWEWK